MSAAPSPETDTELTPLTRPADGLSEVVETPAALEQVVAAFADATGPVAVDAERASGFRYGQHAYLVQLRRSGAGTALVDPQALPDLHALNQALEGSEWILHSADQDLPCLAELGLHPDRLFDTELAARLLGYERVGLAAMVAEELGLSLAKEHSAADWSTRPLPVDWLRYAALDVEVLIQLRDHLHTELAEAGKLEWARQEFEAVRTAAPPEPRRDPWRRTSGSHKVRDGLGLAILRELWYARDAEAQRRDLSPSRVLPDAAIIAAAVRQPASQQDLAAMREFHARGAARRSALWFGAVQRARSLPPKEYPPRKPASSHVLPPPKAWRKRNPEGAERLPLVRTAVRECAEELHLPQENLLTPAYQRQLAWSGSGSATPEDVAATLRGFGAREWQIEIVAEPLSRTLRCGPSSSEASSADTPSAATPSA